jgi:hypothetical protein
MWKIYIINCDKVLRKLLNGDGFLISWGSIKGHVLVLPGAQTREVKLI